MISKNTQSIISIGSRFKENPLLITKDILPSQPGWVVEGVLNPGVFEFEGRIWLLLRIAERPEQQDGIIMLPILNGHGNYKILEFSADDPEINVSDARLVKYKQETYLSTISHLRLMCSEDGVHFTIPEDRPAMLHGLGPLESYGIEDCRVTVLDGVYHLTYTQVSGHGVGVGLMTTRDWIHFERHGMIFPPHNKDCTLFDQVIGGKYYALHRPSGIDIGGNFIWIASSPDKIHWGNHDCIMTTRPDHWDSARIGAGSAPIKTSYGWIALYHGADASHRYCLGAALLDLEDPSIVIARSSSPLMEPTEDYELNGFFGKVIFSNGHIQRGNQILLYYGAADEVICAAEFDIEDILEHLQVK